MIQAAQSQGRFAAIKTYTRLSGPGWLQSAITLGGGSLSSSLYLGILAGFGMMWLQPFAMVLGILMLGCISYVTLSTGERPFQAINRHINPVLGWAWAISALAANMVWSLPQFSLATGVVQQNLAPGWFGEGQYQVLICVVILILTVGITWSYGSGSRGVRIYETILKLMVAMIIISFLGVVLKLAFSDSGVAWGELFAGFIPDLSRINSPAPGFVPMLEAIPEAARTYWEELIVNQQRDVMISAAATAVGINMTFLLGYSLLARGWDRNFRGLAVFDLSTGMFVPFVVATSCVVIAAASQFHLKPAAGFLGEQDAAGELIVPSAKISQAFQSQIDKRNGKLAADGSGEVEVTEAEKKLIATLVKRDVNELALSLEPFTGSGFAHWIFGLGVVGMALSTITILMLISGFVICEMFGLPRSGWPFRLGCLAACTGVIGPFVWKDASAWLAVPTSVFGMSLLPIAYISFFLLFNQKSLLKEHMPVGRSRWIWNGLLFVAALVATGASLYVINQKAGFWGWVGVGGLLLAALIGHLLKPRVSTGGGAATGGDSEGN